MNRKLTTIAAAAAVLAAGLPAAASAQQSWMAINQRQAQLDQRINVATRNGQLTAAEAARLRAEFNDIARLETRYRVNGLSMSERADLDRRFDALSSRIRIERADGDRQGWMAINQRQAQLDQRINVATRNGQLTAAEAARLRGEFNDIARLEARYRVNGLSMSERADLDRRFDALSSRIRIERADRDRNRNRWATLNINRQQAMFQQRLNRAVRDGRITSRQAANLRAEYRSIANLETQYRRGGLSPRERADLDMRLDRLQSNFRASVNASQYAYGYNTAPNLFEWLLGI